MQLVEIPPLISTISDILGFQIRNFMINVPKYELVGPNTTGEVLKTKIFFKNVLSENHQVEICLKQMTDIDLAGFNLLVSAFIEASRQGKAIKYSGAQLEKFNHLKELTRFDHVFA